MADVLISIQSNNKNNGILIGGLFFVRKKQKINILTDFKTIMKQNRAT